MQIFQQETKRKNFNFSGLQLPNMIHIPFNITVIQVYALTTNAEEAEQFYENL